MNLYKVMAVTFAFALLIAPALAEFKGKKGERATYESLVNGQSSGTAVYGVEGTYRIGNVVTQKFQIADPSGGRIEGYLDSNGKPIKVDVFDSNSSQANMTAAFDHQKRIVTISYNAPALYGNTTSIQKQSINVNITSNTYANEFLAQSLRYMPIKEGYKTSFQVFSPLVALMMAQFAPYLLMMGTLAGTLAGITTDDLVSLSIGNATLQVTGRENIRVGNSNYDCYKITLKTTQDLPPQLAAQLATLDPSMASQTSQSSEQQMWLRTSDLLMVRSYSEEVTTMPNLTNTTQPQQQKITSETRLTSLTYV